MGAKARVVRTADPVGDSGGILKRSGPGCQPSGRKATALFVAPSAYILSGLATWLDYLVPGLEERGWNVVLGLVTGTGHDFGAYRSVHSRGTAIPISNRTGSHEGRVRAIQSAIREVGADIAISVNIPDTFKAVARVRREGGGTKAVQSIHSIDEWTVDDAKRWSAVLDGIVSTNALPCRLVREVCGLHSPAVFHAPCGVEVGPLRAARELEGGSLRIAFVGRLVVEQKRALDLLEIAAEMDRRSFGWHVTIAGAGEAEETLRRELSRKWKNGAVEFLGFVAPGDLPASVYSRADVLLVTSSWETGPIVIWEAMGNGLAVLSSRYVGSGAEGSLREDENCLMFPVGDAREAANQLERLTDAALRERLSRGGRALVERNYTREASIVRWDEALRSILAGPPRGPVPDALLRVPPAGRLDRWLGPGLGERVRRAIGCRFPHTSPGSEWPHTYSGAAGGGTFERWARSLDVTPPRRAQSTCLEAEPS